MVFGFDPRGVRIQLAQCLDLISAMLGFAAPGKQMLQRIPVKAIELRKACGILEIHRIRNGAVFGLDWRGVRIRLARCSDLTWRDVWSGFGLGLLASSLRLQASGFRLRAPGASAASFRLHAPGPKCRHRVCVRIRVQPVCKLRAHILRKSL